MQFTITFLALCATSSIILKQQMPPPSPIIYNDLWFWGWLSLVKEFFLKVFFFPSFFSMRLQPHVKWSLSKITHSHCFWLMLLPENSNEPIIYRATTDCLFLGLPVCSALFRTVPMLALKLPYSRNPRVLVKERCLVTLQPKLLTT